MPGMPCATVPDSSSRLHCDALDQRLAEKVDQAYALRRLLFCSSSACRLTLKLQST